MEETFIENKCKDKNYKLSKKLNNYFFDEKLILKWMDIFSPFILRPFQKLYRETMNALFFIILKKVEKNV